MNPTSRRQRSGGRAQLAASLALAVAVTGMIGAPAYADPSSTPVVLRTSEGVDPGDLVVFYGEFFTAGTTVSLDSVDCPVAMIDPLGHYLSCVAPTSMPAGQWSATLTTSAGSVTTLVNEPRPLFIDQPQGWAGQAVRIVGRDLQLGTVTPQVRLSSAASTVSAVVTESDAYSLVFEVPALAAAGNWAVEVSTDSGSSWVALSEQELEVVAAGTDPLALGVAWAGEFTWTAFPASAHGAIGDGIVDDRAALQSAIDAAKLAGGGMVTLDAGTFLVDGGLKLPSGVTLVGDGENTTVRYTGDGTDNLFEATGDGATTGLLGVANMRVETDVLYPNAFFWLGQAWDASTTDSSLRTASRIFISGVHLEYESAERGTGGRGYGAVFVADSKILIADSTFDGYRGNVQQSYVNEYLTIRDSHFEYSAGQVTNGAKYGTVTNTTVVAVTVAETVAEDAHGILTKTFSYVAGNTIEGFGTRSRNDGEPILAQVTGSIGATKMYGDIVAASGSTVEVDPLFVRDWLLNNNPWDRWHIVILEGRGQGQALPIAALDESTSTVTVEGDWLVEPDATSKFVVSLPLMNNTYVGNTIMNNAKGIWFYGDSYGGVIANNTSIDSEGVMVNTAHTTAQGRHNYAIFDRVIGNDLSGDSPLSLHGNIGTRLGVGAQQNLFGLLAYGQEYRDNTITGVLPTPATGNYSEAPNINGLYARWVNNLPARPVAESIIFEGNHLADLDKGISFDAYTNGLLLHNNTFDGVATEHSTSVSPLPIVP